MGQFAGVVSFHDVYKSREGVWYTTLFFKASDVHAYVTLASCHPPEMLITRPLWGRAPLVTRVMMFMPRHVSCLDILVVLDSYF